MLYSSFREVSISVVPGMLRQSTPFEIELRAFASEGCHSRSLTGAHRARFSDIGLSKDSRRLVSISGTVLATRLTVWRTGRLFVKLSSP